MVCQSDGFSVLLRFLICSDNILLWFKVASTLTKITSTHLFPFLSVEEHLFVKEVDSDRLCYFISYLLIFMSVLVLRCITGMCCPAKGAMHVSKKHLQSWHSPEDTVVLMHSQSVSAFCFVEMRTNNLKVHCEHLHSSVIWINTGMHVGQNH